MLIYSKQLYVCVNYFSNPRTGGTLLSWCPLPCLRLGSWSPIDHKPQTTDHGPRVFRQKSNRTIFFDDARYFSYTYSSLLDCISICGCPRIRWGTLGLRIEVFPPTAWTLSPEPTFHICRYHTWRSFPNQLSPHLTLSLDIISHDVKEYNRSQILSFECFRCRPIDFRLDFRRVTVNRKTEEQNLHTPFSININSFLIGIFLLHDPFLSSCNWAGIWGENKKIKSPTARKSETAQFCPNALYEIRAVPSSLKKIF